MSKTETSGQSSLRPRSSKSRTSSSKSRIASSKSVGRSHEDDCVLYLKQSHANFNAPSKRESIFFDECNREIISLTNNVGDTSPPSKTLVICQQTSKYSRIELALPIGKKILSIKFNHTRSVIAYHVERNIVEFINIKDKILDTSSSSSSSLDSENFKFVLEDKRYVQSSRAKNSKLIGFLWTGPNEVVIITDLSVEYYQLDPVRRRLSLVKIFQSATNWFVYQPSKSPEDLEAERGDCSPVRGQNVSQSSLLIVSTGSLGNSMQPYMFTNGRVAKLQRFDVEGDWHESDKLELFERSITIGFIYGFFRLMVLQHESLNVKSKGSQIVLYTTDLLSGVTTKTHTLDLDTSGRFAINIIDNLVIAHDQPSKTSFIFDIAIQSTEKSDCPNHYVSLIDSRPIRPLEIVESKGKQLTDMYSLNWVFFQPNFIVDAKLGLLLNLKIDLESMQNVLQDNILLLGFLARRSNSEKVILNRCKQIVCDSYRLATGLKQKDADDPIIIGQQVNPLADVSSAFDILSYIIRPAPSLQTEEETIAPHVEQQDSTNWPYQIEHVAYIQQEDVDREIFRSLLDMTVDALGSPAHFHFVSSVLLEFIFAVQCRGEKNVEFCIYERLVKCLVSGKRFFQIIQMVRSEILKSSKQLACLLISLSDQYKPAKQLGLNMFYRLPCGPPPPNLTKLID